MSAPFLHLICITFFSDGDYALFLCYLGQIDAESAPSNGAIWNKFNEQQAPKHQKSTIFRTMLALF